MKAKMRSAPANAMTMELNWLEIWVMGLVKLRDSVRNDAIIPSDSVPMPVSDRFGSPATAI